jgi:hypothetical protein
LLKLCNDGDKYLFLTGKMVNFELKNILGMKSKNIIIPVVLHQPTHAADEYLRLESVK